MRKRAGKTKNAKRPMEISPMIVRPHLHGLPLIEAYLYEAVARHVEDRGGTVIVIGGIEAQQWPGEPAMNYRVAIKVCGKIPEPIKVPSVPSGNENQPAPLGNPK